MSTYMKKTKTFAFSLFLLFILSGIATAELYKWVDEKGVTHLSDYLPRNSISREKVEVIPTYQSGFKFEKNYKSEYNNPKSGSLGKTPGSGEVKPRKEHEVELYVTSWCPYCKKARNFFLSRGVSFKEYDIEKDKSAAERKKRLDPRRGVPFVVINGQGIHGYIPSAYEKALRDG